MTLPIDPDRTRRLQAAYWAPSFQSMVARTSSITNAFVCAVIPVLPPTADDIEQALAILEIDPLNMRCAYCGDTASEWDHLRPLVLKRRPTGYITEISNLVPACGKCNQSKGNKHWREWMLSNAKLSPTGRGLPDVNTKVGRIEAFESWRKPTQIDFVAILGEAAWDRYWGLCESIVSELRKAQEVADELRAAVNESIRVAANSLT